MHVFILTGAGVSAESGLKTFRDPGVLWESHDPRALATPEAFAHDPALVHRFYNWRRSAAAAAEPNDAHIALAHLERTLAARGDDLTLVTQNVDQLHQRAGSSVIAMHGTHAEVRCTRCGTVAPWAGDLFVETPCPSCGQSGALRPNIVWFGEMPLHLDRIAQALDRADLFVAIGTSGAVYPAAAYAGAARAAGKPTVELNLAPADNADMFDRAYYGKATETVPRFVEMLIEDASFFRRIRAA
jgi:NAD-dependent deacetylase